MAAGEWPGIDGRVAVRRGTAVRGIGSGAGRGNRSATAAGAREARASRSSAL